MNETIDDGGFAAYDENQRQLRAESKRSGAAGENSCPSYRSQLPQEANKNMDTNPKTCWNCGSPNFTAIMCSECGLTTPLKKEGVAPPAVSCTEWMDELETEVRRAHLTYKHELKHGPNYRSEYYRGWRDGIKSLIAKRSRSSIASNSASHDRP